MTEPAHFGKYSRVISEMQNTINYLGKFIESEVDKRDAEIKRLMLIILRLTERDQKEFDEDVTRGVCSFLETESRAKIHREMADAVASTVSSQTRGTP